MLYPQTCCFCGKVSETPICRMCAKEITYIEEPRCKKCGKPVAKEEQEYCYDCGHATVLFEQGKNLWLHKGKVKQSIYQFKYHNRRIYGVFYARELYRLYGEKITEWNIHRILPVPISKKRRRKRGYNQSEIIAKELGRLCNLPVDTTSVIRKKETSPQKELGQKERKKNLENAFVLKASWKSCQNILIIDDIYTTGNTIQSLARAIKENGNHKIWFFTISIGQGF